MMQNTCIRLLTSKDMPNRQRANNRIFGTPPEPLFNADNLAMGADILQDWLFVLNAHNKQNIKITSDANGLFKFGENVDYVFNVCKRFRLPEEARFLAIEIFDRFMVQHISDLYQHVRKSNSKTKLKDWKTIQSRVRKQVPLRIVSCCQLASKLTSHCRAVTPGRVYDFLHGLGHKYSLDSILQSELRVLKTLSYKVSVLSPLLFIETLLEIMGQNDDTLSIKVCYAKCLLMLDLVYLRRKTVYRQLYSIVVDQSICWRNKAHWFNQVENDFMLLAAAVIAATYYIIEQKRADKVIQSLNEISGVPLEDIIDFATILIQEVAED